jgi:hypothetical protein
MPSERIDIAITAKNNASAALKQVQTDLHGLDAAAKTASQGLAAITAGAGIAGIVALGQQFVQLGQEGAQVERVAASFEELARSVGQSSSKMLATLQSASSGTVASYDLMLAANRAMMLGVADSSEEMGVLMQIAADRARLLGLSTTEAFDRLVAGLGRGSALILDDLAITVSAAEANDRYAASLGKTADALTEAEKKQALINQVISDAAQSVSNQADIVDDAAARFERAAAATADARARLAQEAAESTAAGAQFWADILQGALNYFDATQQLIGVEQRATGEISSFNEAAARQAVEAARAAGGIAQLTDKTHDADNAYRMLYSSVMSARAALDAIADTAASTARGIALGAAHAIGAADAYSLYGELTDDLVEYSDTLRLAGFEEDKIAFLVQARGDAMSRQYTKMYAVTRATAAEIPKISEEYQKLQSAIEGVLSSALSLSDIGSADIIEQALGRQDSVNEAARRMADLAVKGWESPWVEYFRTQFPGLWAEAFRGTEGGGDIRAQAAELLRQFEQGLRPELINRELVKERVRAMLIGDANMATMARGIAGELAAELNIPLTEALSRAQGALGVAGGGGSLADGFAQGAIGQIEDSNTGVVVVDTFVSQMRGVFARIEQAGRDAGEVWGRGFQATVEAGVPPGLIALLTDLVTPAVAAGLARQQSLTTPQ